MRISFFLVFLLFQTIFSERKIEFEKPNFTGNTIQLFNEDFERKYIQNLLKLASLLIQNFSFHKLMLYLQKNLKS